jgi:uncharacterized protein (TIGR00255 family)
MLQYASMGGRRGGARGRAAASSHSKGEHMVHSMSGYGKGEARSGTGAVCVEVRTVNHRYIDFSIRMPRSLNGYEKEIEKIVRGTVKRGHVYVTVAFDSAVETESVTINKDLLRRTYRVLSDFAIEEGVPGRVDIGTLLSLPDIFANSLDEVLPESLWTRVREALGIALQRCLEMRRNEGAELVRDVMRRLAVLEKGVARIEKKAPAALKRALARGKDRLRQLLDGSKIDESRWLMEAALMAERTDFSEELVRIQSHLAQFRTVIEKADEVSKSLTFLLQEIHREATTMANKATDASIIRECLSLKEGVEKIREQVQNLE